MQELSRWFPLTHMLEASRAIMLDGKGLVEVMPNVLVMGGMALCFLLLGAWLFRWQSD